MNECINIYELIQKELDKDLTSQELQFLQDHCQWCFECQNLREEYKQMETNLLSLPLLDPGFDFATNIMAKLNTHKKNKTDFYFSNTTSLVAAIIILLSSGLFFVSWLFILPLLGLLLYLFHNYWPIYYLKAMVESISNLLNASTTLEDTTSQIITPSLIGLIVFISFASFILLMRLMITNREDYRYE